MVDKRKIPKHWPKGFSYAKESTIHQLHPSLRPIYLFSENPDDAHRISHVVENKCVHPDIEILPITKDLKYLGPNPHPLVDCKTKRNHIQRGVFATKKIPSGTELGEYVGEMHFHSSKKSLEEAILKQNPSEYSWIAKKRDFFVLIDSKTLANELAFINDFRGLKPSSNVKAEWIVHRGSFYYGYITTCDIEPGEELLTDYGEEYWLAFNKAR
jgi:hypothetical protein